MSLYRDRGVVLRTIRLGEADRIVTLMTEGHGKVRAVAKGVRKTKSRFGARLEPLGHVALLLYQGRELDVITQAESVEHFRSVRENLESMTRATSMLEAVDQLAQERHSNPQLYTMLVGALRALASSHSPMVAPSFFLKLLALEGFEPVLDRCASCGSEAELVAFDIDEGGALCRQCRRGPALTPEALVLMRRILGGGLSSVLSEPDPPGGHEVAALSARSVEHHLERRLRSLGVLDRA
jgi:DNA repair protein RecO (recombination protein O)